ncbi:hypothetical protein [Sinorhizobium meliloti]|uniref:hypothetical protein n=1 Tax=Rhizobium meliloti TaxID=382 RepID=UPI0002FD9CDF|nr:hypothetical protein [Sinorhizobium meliloti]
MNYSSTGTRKPQLTAAGRAGRAVLAVLAVLAEGIDGLRTKVKALHDGLEVEVDMAVDVMLPRSGWERCCEPSPKRSDCMSRRSGR